MGVCPSVGRDVGKEGVASFDGGPFVIATKCHCGGAAAASHNVEAGGVAGFDRADIGRAKVPEEVRGADVASRPDM